MIGSAQNYLAGVVMSADGNVLAGRLNNRLYRWTPSAGLQQGAAISTEPYVRRSISAISGDGQIMIQSLQDDEFVNTQFTSSTWQPGDQIGQLPEDIRGKYIFQTNRDATVMLAFDGRLQYFYWTSASGIVWLPGTDGSYVKAPSDVSSDGSVIVGNLNNDRPFRWTAAGGSIGLGLPLGATGGGCLVSGDGNTVILNATLDLATYHTAPYVLKNSGEYQFLGNAPGFIRTVITDVNYDGSVVVGTAYRADGTTQAFRARIR